jgi:hypothetical protein
MNNIRSVGNGLAPFFRAHGYTRKNNKFYKIQNNIAFCAGLERPGGLYSLCYIIPLYMPTPVHHITYGSRLERFKPFPVPPIDFLLYGDSQCDEFVQRTMQCCEKYFFPLYNRISTPEGLIEYLNQGYKCVRGCWDNLDLCSYYELRIYTNFILSNYNEMLADIPLIYDAIDSRRTTEESNTIYKQSIANLVNFRLATDKQKEEFIKNTIEQSMISCRFKKQ